MKIAALLCGVLASAFAWAGSYILQNLEAEFLLFWAPTNSQQFIGLMAWHAAVAGALVGGVIAVLSPVLGGMIMAAAAGGWAAMGVMLPSGFAGQILIPLAFSALGAVAAFAALLRGAARRNNEREEPSLGEPEANVAAAATAPAAGTGLAVAGLPATLSIEQDATQPDSGPAAEASEPASEPARAPERARIELPQRAPMPPPTRRSAFVIANALVLLLLTAAVAVLLYSSIRTGQLGEALSGPPLSAATTGEPQHPATAAVADAASVFDTAGSDGARMTSLAVATGSARQWSDPFEYCAAVGTVDAPDRRYAGPSLTAPIADALGVPLSSPSDRARWRCYDGRLLACASFAGPRCALTPTVTEMLEYCSRNPGTAGLQAPNGTWSCNGSNPQVPEGDTWPMDPRGFLPEAWVAIAPPEGSLSTNP